MAWIEREVQDADRVVNLGKELRRLPLPLARALVLRGIDSYEKARSYFRATMDDAHDPRLLSTMDEAAHRLARAIQARERVLVYGDFDADGITSTALMVRFLHSRGTPAEYYLPSRFGDGFGFHERGVTVARENGATLVVVVDCGTTAVETAAIAQRHGLDVIICDHHENGGANPKSVAHLNPKRNGCAYPFKELSACGVAYKLVQATLDRLNEPPEAARVYLDLVALATVCDMVPLRDENRIMVREGIEVMRSASRPGLRALMNIARVKPPTVRAKDFGMRLGPRLNAAGRLGHAGIAVDLLLTDSVERAQAVARQLEQLNTKRKSLGREVERDASKRARTQLAGRNKHVIVLYDRSWPPGVLGPAASRMVKTYGRPAVLLANDPQRGAGVANDSDQSVAGSARSIEGLNIHDALDSCQDILTRFGGHAQAAGLTMRSSDVSAFRQRLNTFVRERVDLHSLVPEKAYDARLPASALNKRFMNVLKQFEPFGKDNEEPIYYIPDLHVASVKKTWTGEHLMLTVTTPDSNCRLGAIAFRQGDKFSTLEEARMQRTPIELLCAVTENTFRGTTRLQLRVEEIRTADLTR